MCVHLLLSKRRKASYTIEGVQNGHDNTVIMENMPVAGNVYQGIGMIEDQELGHFESVIEKEL